MRIRITAAAPVSADTERRTLTGTVYRYGEQGSTNVGQLSVGLTMPPPPIGLPVSLEHDRQIVRAAVALVDNDGERLRIAARVVDGELGDQALEEAMPPSRKRAAFSMDIEDAVVVDGVIVSGRWEAIGQVEHPAFNSARIDRIAASINPGEPMTEQQRARLRELAAMNARTDEQETEFEQLRALAVAEVTNPEAEPTEPAESTAPAAPAAVAASAAAQPAVPGGAPAPAGSATRTQPRGSALAAMVSELTAALRGDAGRRVEGITAALTDIVHSDHTENIEAPAWSGELWSGLQYVPEWSDLLAQGTLTNWEGRGWRFTSKLAIQDYAGDKVEIPSDQVTTEPSTYEAARAAVGVDVDRKFFDFPNEGFVSSLVEQVRESWEILKDAKAKAYILSKAVAATRALAISTTNGDATVTAAAGSFTASDVGATITGTGIPASTTILSVTDGGTIELSANATATGNPTATIGVQASTVLKAAARVSMDLKRRRVGRAGYIMLNDEDMFTLLDVAEKDVPVFLNLWGVEAGDFRSSPDVPRGTVIGGVKQAGVFRQLPGSPIRVSAQNLAHGGIDEAFFGYWAIEEHHKSGIASVKYRAVA